MRTKIVMNRKIIDQVRDFNYLGCNISSLERPRRRWEGDIRMDLEEIGINAGNWVDSAQNRNYWRALVNSALNLLVP